MKSCRVLLAVFLTASWLAAINAHASTITVTNANDSGPGSLRQAMADANDGDIINATGVSGSIELSSGELLVEKNVSIDGPGAGTLSVENARSSRVFDIASGETVTISGLAIKNGKAASGAGIYNSGLLTVVECAITGNEGGGIRENGLGGGTYNASGAQIAIINSTVSGNNVGSMSQQTSLGGGIYNDSGATLTIINCSINGNEGDQGGGIYNAGSMQIAGTSLSDNRVGGGISQETSLGGAICNSGTLEIVNSTITGNTASGTLQSGGVGGGIFNSGTLSIVNTTISGNVASGVGASPGHGDAIGNGSGNIVIQNSTINGNTADGQSASGSGGNVFIAGGTLEIGNTIMNTGSGANILDFSNQGTVISDGYNLSSDNGAGYLIAAGDQINTDPKLGPLQDNGGPTFTHALLGDSPAIDAGNPNVNPYNFQLPLIYDQRGFGFDRVKKGRIDVGAFELQAAPMVPPRPTPPPTPTPQPSATPTPTPTLTPSPTPPPSPTPTPSPTPVPSPTEDPRKVALAEVRREIRFTRTALRQLNGTTSVPPSVFVWLKVRLRVLEARLAYPLDEGLSRIDRHLLNGGPMSEASRRKLLARLNARLDALRSGR